MAIPQQVIEQGKVSDEAMAEYFGKDGEVTTQEKPAAPAEAAPPAEPIDDLNKKYEPPTDPTEGKTPGTMTEAQDIIASLRSAYAQIAHKYSVIWGKYDKEVRPALDASRQAQNAQNQVQVLTDQLIAEKTKVARLEAEAKAEPARAAAAPKTPAGDPSQVDLERYFSPEVMDKLDNEGVSPEILGILVNSVLQATTDRTKNIVAPLEISAKEAKQRKEQEAEAAYWDILDTYVPDWEAVNQDPRWKGFLEEPHPGTGERRQNFLSRAEKALAPVPIVEMFNDFKRLVGLPIVELKRPGMKDVVDPVTSKPAPTGDQPPLPKGKIYTRDEIKAFYDDASKGLYKGRQEAYEAMNADISAALAEGRIAVEP